MDYYINDLNWCRKELQKKLNNNDIYDLKEIFELISELRDKLENVKKQKISQTQIEKQKKILTALIIAEYFL